MLTLPTQIAYAKNEAHQRFLESFNGELKGRINITFLVVIEFVGGSALRKEIETALGNPIYQPEKWYSARDPILMFDHAIRAGLPMERLGRRVMPAFRRTHPGIFEGKTVRNAFEILENAYRADTTYGGVTHGMVVEPTRALVYRKGSPLPCDYFVGVINGLLGIFSIEAKTREVECQWDGAPACCFEANWAG